MGLTQRGDVMLEEHRIYKACWGDWFLVPVARLEEFASLSWHHAVDLDWVVPVDIEKLRKASESAD